MKPVFTVWETLQHDTCDLDGFQGIAMWLLMSSVVLSAFHTLSIPTISTKLQKIVSVNNFSNLMVWLTRIESLRSLNFPDCNRERADKALVFLCTKVCCTVSHYKNLPVSILDRVLDCVRANPPHTFPVSHVSVV